MKKNLLLIMTLTLSLAFAVGLSYVFANDPFVNNNSTPPLNNAYFPVNTGTAAQVKGSLLTGGLSVNEFTANQHAQFDDKLTISGAVYSNLDTLRVDQRLRFGASAVPASVLASGSVHTVSYFQSDTLRHGGAPLAPICTDRFGSTGTIYLCP